MKNSLHPSSFRDPSGFLYRGDDGCLYRQINRCFEADYRKLMDGPLYRQLVEAGLLIEHETMPLEQRASDLACAVVRPRLLPFISYPYEWSFSQLQAAALLTLEIQQRALQAGMVLKDASAYNVQFDGVRPVFIDLLSFETYTAGAPWAAYGQFCRHFLAPLALMALTDVRLGRLSALHLDGVPLDLAARLLPWRTRFRPSLAMHVHWHAWAIQRHSDTSAPSARFERQPQLSRFGMDALLDSLRRTVERLRWRAVGTEWADYQTEHGYSAEALERKQQIVGDYLRRVRPGTVWDLGANVGQFSRLASAAGARVVAFDVDPACVERNFLRCRADGTRNLLPLWLDLANPSPALGWAHRERAALRERGPADVVLALALMHHLAIGNNVPLVLLADFLGTLGRHLIIEFVPKEDVQVARLLRSRADIFADYHVEGFEAAFGQRFRIEDRQAVGDSGRLLYWLTKSTNSSSESANG